MPPRICTKSSDSSSWLKPTGMKLSTRLMLSRNASSRAGRVGTGVCDGSSVGVGGGGVAPTGGTAALTMITSADKNSGPASRRM